MNRTLFSAAFVFFWLVLVAGNHPPSAAESAGPNRHVREPALAALIAEALSNNPQIQALHHRTVAAGHRIKPARVLPDPMLMTGYQNLGIKRFSYGLSPDAQWMFSVSQMFPFPGKRSLKAEAAQHDRQGLEAEVVALRHQIADRVSQVYFDLFLAHRTIALLEESAGLFKRVETAALARYAAGMGTAAEVAMSQTEKYLIAERLAITRQKIGSLEAMMGNLLGRTTPGAIPVPPAPTPIDGQGFNTETLIALSLGQSPGLAAKNRMIAAAEARVRMAEREFYPDLTLAANWFNNGGAFQDMWSITTSINLPLFFKDKQREQLAEAKALLRQAQAELEAEKNMIIAEIRDSGAMIEAATGLTTIYQQALIPKNRQEVALLMADYAAGGTEAAMVIGRSRALVEAQIGYWVQVAAAAKAWARVEALVGGHLDDLPSHDHDQKERP